MTPWRIAFPATSPSEPQGPGSANNRFQVRLWCERQLSIHACFCVALWDTNAHHIRSGVHPLLSWTLAQANIEHSMLATNTWYCRQRGLQTICKQKCKPRRQQLRTVSTVAPGTHSLQSSHKQIFRNGIAFSEGSCQARWQLVSLSGSKWLHLCRIVLMSVAFKQVRKRERSGCLNGSHAQNWHVFQISWNGHNLHRLWPEWNWSRFTVKQIEARRYWCITCWLIDMEKN